MNNYLIPANSKRSMLIFGWFKPIDLIIFLSGIGLTFILIWIFGTENFKDMMFDLIPAIVASVMVMPVPNHRNIWTLTVNVYNYFTSQRKYKWRGWCVLHGEDEGK